MGRRERAQKQRRESTPATTLDGRGVVAKAIARNVRVAPRKVAIIAHELRNKTVAEAFEILDFLHRPSAVPHLRKVLKSAVANAEDTAPEPMALTIGEIRVEGAPMMKRIRPASMGRAVRIRKRMSHIKIYLTEE